VTQTKQPLENPERFNSPNGIVFSDEGLDLLLDIRRARFQRHVWEALSTVRIGAVITYAALARRIGQPDAIFAVANACANSPFAIAISWQRVVRTNRRPGI
jgi:O-6-methylguanine DNA methyltransferase